MNLNWDGYSYPVLVPDPKKDSPHGIVAMRSGVVTYRRYSGTSSGLSQDFTGGSTIYLDDAYRFVPGKARIGIAGQGFSWTDIVIEEVTNLYITLETAISRSYLQNLYPMVEQFRLDGRLNGLQTSVDAEGQLRVTSGWAEIGKVRLFTGLLAQVESGTHYVIAYVDDDDNNVLALHNGETSVTTINGIDVTLQDLPSRCIILAKVIGKSSVDNDFNGYPIAFGCSDQFPGVVCDRTGRLTVELELAANVLRFNSENDGRTWDLSWAAEA